MAVRIRRSFMIFAIIFINAFFITKVNALDLKINDAKIVENKSSKQNVKTTFKDNQIDSKIALNKEGDYVVYEIVLDSNESQDYEIKSIKNNLKNKNIVFEFTHDGEIQRNDKTTLKLKVKYNKKIDNSINNKQVDLTIYLGEKDDIIKFFICIIIATGGIVFMITTRKHKNLRLIALSIIIIPIMILVFWALTADRFTIKLNNISVAGYKTANYGKVIEGTDNPDTTEGESIIISFDPGNGDEIYTREFKEGEKLGELSTPKKEGYKFVSWIDEEENEITPETEPEKDMKLTAKYEAIDYKISYALNGGSAKNRTIYNADTETFKLNNPTRSGYTFVGWTGSNGSKEQKTVTIKKGSYGNKNFEAHFDKSIKNLDITVDKEEFVYNGSEIKPNVVVKDGNVVLTEGVDYKITYENNIDAGTASIIITMLDNKNGTTNSTYSGEITKTFEIKQAQPKLIVPDVTVTYNGKSVVIDPSKIVSKPKTDGKITVKYYTDSDLTHEVDKVEDAGTYYVVATSEETKNYKGATSEVSTIVIERKNIVIPTQEETITYNGKEQTLMTDTEYYTVTGDTTATNAGTYEIIATPTGNYSWPDGTTGPKTITVVISPFDITESNVIDTPSVTYTGEEQTPTPDVIVPLPSILNPTTLTDSDIDYSYENNKNAGTATITITGKGNYTGSITQEFTIDKKAVTYTATNQNKTYDGTALNANTTCSITSGELVTGHSVTCTNTGTITNYVSGGTTKELTNVVIKKGTTDVTSNYDITKVNGKLVIDKRDTTCTSNSDSKTYNGTPLTKAGGSCTNLVSGQTATFDNTGSITNVSESVSGNNTVNTVTIKSGSTDVTGNYNVTKVAGDLTITKREITVKATDQEKDYDGTALNADTTCSVTSGTLVSGHSIECETSGSITDAGTTTKALTKVTVKNNTTDVTGNYNVTKENGTLKIKTQGIDIPTQTSTITYNGTEQTLMTNTEYYTVTGDTTATDAGTYHVTVTPTGNYSWNDGTSTPKTVTIEISPYDISGASVVPTADLTYTGYEQTPVPSVSIPLPSILNPTTLTSSDIDYSYENNENAGTGTITITGKDNYTGSITQEFNIKKREVTYTATDQSKTYDGNALTATASCDITSGTLVTGHSVTCTNTGTITNYVSGGVTKELTNVVIKKGTKDVTSNYDITKVNGKLVIDKRDTTCTSNSDSKTYNGTPLTKEGGSCTNLVSGQTATFDNTGSITNVSESGTGNNTVNTVTIKSGSTDVTNNYNVTKVAGDLTITKRNITVKATDQEKDYDGTALNADTTCSVTSGSLVSGHSLECTTSGSIINAGSTTKTLSTVTVKKNTTNVTNNYNITKVNGTLTVNRKGIDVPTQTNTITYNGTEQTLMTNTDYYTVSGSTKGTNADSYDITVTPKSNYAWSDGTTTAKTVTLVISPYNISGATVVPTADVTYTGSNFTPTPSVSVPLPSVSNPTTLTSSDITYSYSNNKNAGTATITISGKGNYTGSTTSEFTINKAEGYVDLSETSSNIAYGHTSKSFTISSNHGGNITLTDDNPTATVSRSGNTITINNISSISAGTSIKVTVTCGETNNYTEASAEYTLNITTATLTGGSVVIRGHNAVGLMLTADVTDTTPVGNYTYQWYSNTSDSTSGGTPIEGATTHKYEVQASEAGKYIYVEVTASKDSYESVTFKDKADIVENGAAIAKHLSTVPTDSYCKDLTYTGSTQVLTNTAGTGYAFYDNSGINAGEYTVTAKLKDNYIWRDFTTEDKTFTCSIAKSNTTTTVSSVEETYDGTTKAATDGVAKLNSNNSTISGTLTYSYYNGSSCEGTALSSAPKNAGNYSLIVTLTGTSNYNTSSSSCTSVVINKRNTTCTSNDGSKTYDGTPLTATGGSCTNLLSGDTATLTNTGSSSTIYNYNGDVDFDGDIDNDDLTKLQQYLVDNDVIISRYNGDVNDSGTINMQDLTALQRYLNGDTTAITPSGEVDNTIGSVVIKKGSTDVTNNYNITKVAGKLRLYPIRIVVTADDQSKTYDGSELIANNNCTLTQGSLLTGRTLTCTNSGSRIDVGTENKEISNVTIMNGSTNETDYYDITKRKGTLTVTKRAITCTSADGSKTYDGSTPLSNTSGGSCTNVVSGQTVTFHNSGSSSTIYSLKGDVDFDGDIDNSDYNLMQQYLVGADVEISMLNADVDNNGTVNMQDYASLQRYLGGDTTVFSPVGEVDNTISEIVIKDGDKYVTNNYDITEVAGKLRLYPIRLTVKARDQEKTYDGTALNATNTCDIINGTKVSSHYIRCTATGSRTEAGDGTKKLTNVTIVNGSDEDLTSNYDIMKKDGNLTVNKKEITCTSSSSTKVYDGSNLTASGGTCTGLVTGHTASFSNSGVSTQAYRIMGDANEDGVVDESDVDVIQNHMMGLSYLSGGGYANADTDNDGVITTADISAIKKHYKGTALLPDVGNDDNTISSVTISDGSTGVTNNYTINKVAGKLKITPKSATCTSSSATKVYDGTPLTATGGTCTGLLTGHTATFTNSGSSTDAYRIMGDADGDGSVTNDDATLVQQYISGWDVTVDYESADADEDGELTVSDVMLIQQHVSGDYDLPVYGNGDNKIRKVVISSGSTDVSSNYNINRVYGKLKVTPKSITCTSTSNEKVYDGTALTSPGGSCTGLVSGHTATFVNSGTNTSTIYRLLGDVDYDGDVDDDDYDLLAHYLAEWNVSISENNADVDQDGSITMQDYALLQKHLAGWDNTFDTPIGIVPNNIRSITITGPTNLQSSANLTRNYSINRVAGTLKVYPILLTVKATDQEKIYDGTALTATNTCEIVSGTKLSSHTLRCTATGSRIPIGEGTKKLTGVTIVNGSDVDFTNKYEITKMNGKLIVNNNGYFSDDSCTNFENDSWSTIKNIVTDSPTAYSVGCTKTVNMGTFGTHTVRVANNSTPTECSTSGHSQTACGFVVEFVDIIAKHNMNSTNSNAGGWRDSSMRTYVNSDIYNALPTQLKTAIIDTVVVSGHGTTTGETNFTTTDKLYLLSAVELGIDVNDIYDTAETESHTLKYYEGASNSKRVKYYDDDSSQWRLRTARGNATTGYIVISSAGEYVIQDSTSEFGVSPAFRLK